jgi:hypothetical protein
VSGPARPFHLQDLIAADAEMPVGDAPQLIAGELERIPRGIEHDEVVAQALHFREAQSHSRRAVRVDAAFHHNRCLCGQFAGLCLARFTMRHCARLVRLPDRCRRTAKLS